MKTDIHPDYVEAKVTCSCGNSFTTRSTRETLHVELCNECHPFFTGKQKLVDSGGRVERFQRRYGRTSFTRSEEEAEETSEEASDESPSEATEASGGEPSAAAEAQEDASTEEEPEAQASAEGEAEAEEPEGDEAEPEDR